VLDNGYELCLDKTTYKEFDSRNQTAIKTRGCARAILCQPCPEAKSELKQSLCHSLIN